MITIVLITVQVIITFTRKRVVELASPSRPALVPTSQGARIHQEARGAMMIILFFVSDHLKFIRVPWVVSQSSPALDKEIHSQADTEDGDQNDGAVNPDLRPFGDTKCGEERRQETIRVRMCGL